MCMFSRAVLYVGKTRIFARASGVDNASQLLAYAMSVEVESELAMVLPVPVPPGAPEDAVRFIDLSGMRHFFVSLDAVFPFVPLPSNLAPQSLGRAAPFQQLAVHAVGDFDASFVPSKRDFERLDARFRLAPEVWNALPQYDDWGFVIAKLRPPPRRMFGLLPANESRVAVHPLAFEFPRRDRAQLFFPTMHVHDGRVHEQAAFDHALYMQTHERPNDAAWEGTTQPLGELLDVSPSRDVLAPGLHAYRRVVTGSHPNQDILVAT